MIQISIVFLCHPTTPKLTPSISSTFQSICAKAGDEPCCDWVGEDGAGHYVKMVHNGIEYGDMQLICEAYHLMKDALGMTCDEMSEVGYGYRCSICCGNGVASGA